MTVTPYNIRAVGDSAVRNIIINGAFDFWQRGTSFSTNNTYTADRYKIAWSGYNPTVTQSTDVPTVTQSGFKSQFSYLITNGTGATPTSGQFLQLQYRMEGQDYQNIHAKTARLQFWVKSSVVGTFCISLNNSGTSRSYVTTYNVGSTNWEFKSIDVMLDNSGTWLFDTGIGMYVLFNLAAGTSFQTSTLNTWASNNAQGYSGQTQWGAITGATFQLAQVALYPGNFEVPLKVPFQRCGRSIGHELQLCQRYFEKSFSLETAPGAASGNCTFYPFDTGSLTRLFFAGNACTFKTTKRISGGTLKLYSEDGTSAGTIGSISAYNASATKLTINSANSPDTSGFGNAFITATGAATSGLAYIANWTVDAEL